MGSAIPKGTVLVMASSSCWFGMMHEDDAEPRPHELNTVTRPRFLVVCKDKLTVKYVGKGNHSHDVGSVRTDLPCPQHCLLYYYEVTVVDDGARGCISVGMADGDFPLNRRPGWEPNSYAYHGEDGRKYSDCERGEPVRCPPSGRAARCGTMRRAPPHRPPFARARPAAPAQRLSTSRGT